MAPQVAQVTQMLEQFGTRCLQCRDVIADSEAQLL